MSNGNGKTYKDPVKALAREKVKEFISRAYPDPKRRRKLNVLCFPGAEVEGEEALEVRHIYDQLAIPRANITGLEYNTKKAKRLRQASLGIEVVCQDDISFLQQTNRTFDIISLDYTTYFGDRQRYAIDLISAGALLGPRGVLVTNYYGAREGDFEKQSLVLNEKLARAGLSIADVFKMGFDKAYELADQQQVELKDSRSRAIQTYIFESLSAGKVTLDSLILRKFYEPDYIEAEEKVITEAVESSKREGRVLPIGRNAIEIAARIGTTNYYNRKQVEQIAAKVITNMGFSAPIASLFVMDLMRSYVTEDHESYSYVSNTSSPMLMDIWLANNFTHHFPKNIFRIIPAKVTRNSDGVTYKVREPMQIVFFEGYNQREEKEQIEKIERAFNQVMLPRIFSSEKKGVIERQHLGSSCKQSEQKGRENLLPITREQAIELLRSGMSTQDICAQYSGLTRRELGALKAWHGPNNGNNGLRKPKTSGQEYPAGLVEIVRDELSRRRQDDNYRISTNDELVELTECAKGLVTRCLRECLSEEERGYRRRAILSQTASDTISKGRGIARQTTEERRKIGSDNYSNGKGIASLTTEQRREIGTRNAEMNMTVKFGENNYHSASEAAVAGLLEKYISGWKVERGKTWQVNGHSLAIGAIDFFVNGNFVEYHPPKTYYGNGDFQTHEEYAKFKGIKLKIREEHGKERADVFQRRVEGIIKRKYTESRASAIAKSDYAGTHLIYCANADDVYDRVVLAYSQTSPSREEFLGEFRRLHRKIKKDNKNA